MISRNDFQLAALTISYVLEHLYLFFCGFYLFASTRSLSGTQSILHTPTSTWLYVALRLHEAAVFASSDRILSVPRHQTRSIVYAFFFGPSSDKARSSPCRVMLMLRILSFPALMHPYTPSHVPGVTSLSAAMRCDTFSLPTELGSLLAPVQLEAALRVLVPAQAVDHLSSLFRLHHNPLVALADEPTVHSSLNPLQQPIPVPLHIVRHNSPRVNPQLIPRHNLHQLLQRAVPAAQRHEAAASTAFNHLSCHHLLARVHVVDHRRAAEELRINHPGSGVVVLIFDAVFVEFALEAHQGFRDDAVHGVGAGERDEGFGDFAHDADGAAAVDEVHAILVEGAGEIAGGGEVGGGSSWGSAAAGGGISGWKGRMRVWVYSQDADGWRLGWVVGDGCAVAGVVEDLLRDC